MKKRIIASLLLSFSILSFSSVSAHAIWKKDAYNNRVWVEKDGIKQGWNYIDNYWYYLGADGIPITGWLKDGDSWYYMWSNGTMAYNSWMTNGGFWYYFDEDGKMVTDFVNVENREYDFTNAAIILSRDVDGTSQSDSQVSEQSISNVSKTIEK